MRELDHFDKQLPFFSVEMEGDVISTFNMQKPVPNPLEFINLAYAGTTLVGHVSPIPSTILDISFTFVVSSFNAQLEPMKHK